MKHLRRLLSLSLLLVALSAPAWAGDMPTPPAPTLPPAAAPAPVEVNSATTTDEVEESAADSIAATLLNVVLAVADLF